jgi:tetratricopeptide (TPR) repeat protein
LPEWLTSNSNVWLVLPEQTKLVTEAAVLDDSQTVDSKQEVSTDLRGDANRAVPFLDAAKVFDELILTLKPATPKLTSDPLGFFADSLHSSLVGDSSEDPESDPYAIQSVIARLRALRDKEQQIQPSPIDSLMESIRNAVRQSDVRTAIRLVSEVKLDELTAKQLKEFNLIFADAGSDLDDNSSEELACHELVVATGDRLEKKGALEASARRRVAGALVSKGVVLGALNRSQEELAVYDEVVVRYAKATEIELRELVARALINKGITLKNLNQADDAIATYDEVIRLFGKATEPEFRELVARAFLNKGIQLGALKRPDEAIAIFDEVVRRYGEANELELCEQVATALVNKGFQLGMLDRNEEAIAVYEEVLSRYPDAREIGLRDQVAQALFGKGFRLGLLNRSEEAIATYDEAIRQYGEATDTELRVRVAKALGNKGFRLRTLNRNGEAIAAYEEVVRRYDGATESELQRLVAKAKIALDRLAPEA